MTLRNICPDRNSPESSEAPIVFVVDDDPSVRDALEVAIRSIDCQPRMATSVDEVLALPRDTTPSCLLVELHLAGSTDLGVQRILFDRTGMPVIFMSEHVHTQAAVQLMKAGALDVLTKPLMIDALLPVIRHAIERSRAALDYLAQIARFQERYASLSARERQVMGLLVSGRLNKQVGGDLGISEYTVKVHRGRMMRKMQVRSFAELVSTVTSMRLDTERMTPISQARPESPRATETLLRATSLLTSLALPV